MKKRMVLLAALTTAWCLSGCAGSTRGTVTGNESVAVSEATEGEVSEKEMSEEAPGKSDEGETAIEKGREEASAEGAGNKKRDTAILVVSFGTSYHKSRDITIGAIEKAIADAFPEYEVRRAFTAQIIIDILKERDGLEIDNVTEALDRAVADGVHNLIVQPTHLMNGLEYQDVIAELEKYRDDFDQLVVGEPLLTSDKDFEAVARAITDAAGSYEDGETAILYMGHGTEAESNQVYAKMQETLNADGFGNYYIGTVEAKPDLEDILAALKENGSYKRVVLAPLMVVAGDHANNDMAGEKEDSWKSVLTAEGYETECVLQGLGELEAIRQIYVEHVKAAAGSLLAFGMRPGSSSSFPKEQKQGVSDELTYTSSMELKYAREFSVDYYEGGYALITIAGSERYLLVPESGTIPGDLDPDIVILQQPLTNLYLAASAAMDMFVSLDALPLVRFSAIKPEGWYIPQVREAMERGKLLYAGKYAAPDYEQILAGHCTLAIENTMIYHTPQVKEQLERFGIPVLVDYSSYEKEPLGRTEWVRLYGLLADRREEAEKAFASEEAVFASVQKEEIAPKTVAFFYITSNGEVNVRKSSDYLPKMIALAGGSYVFEDLGDEEAASSTVTMQFEKFYEAAQGADYLIYNSTVEGELDSLEDLLSQSSLLKNCKAVQEKQVFCTTKNLYQSSMALGTILHDLHEILAGREEKLTYFYKLE